MGRKHTHEEDEESALQAEKKSIVRLVRTSLDGTKPAMSALLEVKGVGPSVAHSVLKTAGVNPYVRLGELEEDQLKKIEAVLLKPAEHGLPWWVLNRQKDYETGESLHLLGDDIKLTKEKDIKKMKEIRSWRGIRHHLGLKVRGQRTRSTGRVGRSVGYKRKKG